MIIKTNKIMNKQYYTCKYHCDYRLYSKFIQFIGFKIYVIRDMK